jgi:hypothetical protein
MFVSVWKKVVRRQPGVRSTRRCPGRASLARCAPLSLEELENRMLLSTFTVTDLGDAGVGSGLQGDLRYAINTANSNADLSNRIIIQPGLTGTITLTQDKFVISKALEVDGPGADLLTVSGNRASGVFDITAPAGQAVLLSGLTIADGTGAGEVDGFIAGGGLFNDAATVVLDRTTFSRNTVPPGSNVGGGGAIFNFHGTMTLNANTITDNHADNAPGVAINNQGTMTIHNSTVSGNSGSQIQSTINNGIYGYEAKMTIDHSLIADNGGPLANGSTLTLTDSRVSHNTGIFGGGLFNGGNATLTNATITDNSATGTGGGIFNIGGQLTVTGGTIAGNTALYAGGIYTGAGTLQVTNSTISGNTSEREGGGIYYDSGFMELTSTTITLNTTTSTLYAGGGGIYADGALALLRNTIVAANQSALTGPDVDGQVVSLGHNLVGQTDDSTGWVATDLTGTSDTPLDPHLGPLQDNGGPTQTHALFLGSPALNKGDSSLLNSTDQRGTVRVSSFSHGIDIGAFQTEDAFQFRILAPTNVTAGEAFGLTVIALDQWGNTASTYTGTVHFSSTDLFAQLPDDSTFSGDDAGAHTFSVTLRTPGTQGIGVVDASSLFITGSATVDVADNSEALGSPASGWDLFPSNPDSARGHRQWGRAD